MATVQLSLVRGGTSKGAFLPLAQVPADPAQRFRWCLQLMGSPDPMQLDGLGGTHSSTSKIVAVAPATTVHQAPWAAELLTGQDPAADDAGRQGTRFADCDLVYWFAQVGIAEASVDWRGNCGNLTSAVVPYALHAGMLTRPDGAQTVRILNLNTGTKIDIGLEVKDGRLAETGDFHIAGVPGTGSRIDTRYLDPAGAVTGAALPTGQAREEVRFADPRTGKQRTIAVSIVDIATPIVIADPGSLELPQQADPAALNSDPGALGALEALRVAAAKSAGVVSAEGEVYPAVPRVVLLEPADAGLLAYATSMQRIHHSLPATVILAIAGAARIPGTLAALALPDTPGSDVEITHPKGTVVASSQGNSGAEPGWVSLPRTARILLDGTFCFRTEDTSAVAALRQ